MSTSEHSANTPSAQAPTGTTETADETQVITTGGFVEQGQFCGTHCSSKPGSGDNVVQLNFPKNNNHSDAGKPESPGENALPVQKTSSGRSPSRKKGRKGGRPGHGKRDQRILSTVDAVRKRTLDPNHRDYHRYAGMIAEAWKGRTGRQKMYEHIAIELGPPPTRNHTLDRIDPILSYQPGNLRWATKSQQSRNRLQKDRGEYAIVHQMATAWRDARAHYFELKTRQPTAKDLNLLNELRRNVEEVGLSALDNEHAYDPVIAIWAAVASWKYFRAETPDSRTPDAPDLTFLARHVETLMNAPAAGWKSVLINPLKDGPTEHRHVPTPGLTLAEGEEWAKWTSHLPKITAPVWNAENIGNVEDQL